VIDAARRQWHHDTEPLRTRHELAGAELTRRGLPRDPTPTPAEQLPLLDLPASGEAGEVGEAGRARERCGHTAATGSLAPVVGAAASGQTRVLDMTPDPRDVPAASALGSSTVPASQPGRTPITLAQALRQLDISTQLRPEHEQWTDAVPHFEHRTRGRGHDTAAEYLLRAHADAGTHQEHSHDLDLGTDY
jgi:hypothetical protein